MRTAHEHIFMHVYAGVNAYMNTHAQENDKIHPKEVKLNPH